MPSPGLEKAKLLAKEVSVDLTVCFNPKELVKHYPRGEKELLGPFHRFFTSHMIDWLEQHGVELKIEDDGRMFPVTDSSETIIYCFTQYARKLGVEVSTLVGIEELTPSVANGPDGGCVWTVKTNRGENISADAVIVCSGSAQKMWDILAQLGHTVVPPVPSLFAFNIKDARLEGLSGVPIKSASVTATPSVVENADGGWQKALTAHGPLLITHHGISGPAVLRLSAWGARLMHAEQHRFAVRINFCGKEFHAVREELLAYKTAHAKREAGAHPLFDIPERLWRSLLRPEKLEHKRYGDFSKENFEALITAIANAQFHVDGKSTNKDEFVTAGGVALSEVDFRTMQSKKFPSLFFAGEVLDIDAITGGFNFQAAWTTAWLAAQAV